MIYKKMNLLKPTLLSAVIGTVIALAGCDRKIETSNAIPPSSPSETTDTPSYTAGTAIDDSVITTKVKANLLADSVVKGLDITVETRKGEVQLSGFVDDQTQANRAAELARATDGVRNVDNKMSVRTPASTVGAVVDDGIVTAKVRAALLNDPSVRSMDVTVATSKGEVQLSGFVDSPMQIARATEIAKTVEGVKSVNNKMGIKK